MYREHKTAGRLPSLALRTEAPEDELEEYDLALAAVRKYDEDNAVARARPLVDGQPYARGYWSAWTNAPRLYAVLRAAGQTVTAYQNRPGWFSAADHELIDLVLGFDSGYWAFHAGHTANAITSGVRIGAIEALRDGRGADLTPDERQVVEFIRAVCDGTVTDEIWAKMVARIGTVKGTIGLAFHVCVLWAHHRMMWAFGVPAIGEEDWNGLMEGYRTGGSDPAAATQDYVWDAVTRPQGPAAG